MTATIIVSGALANKPYNGGEAWVRMSWVEGLRRLGFSVFFLEQIAGDACVDGHGKRTAFRESVNLAYFRKVVGRFNLAERAALVADDGADVWGSSCSSLVDLAESAALLVNISGHLSWKPVLERVRCKAYVDIDPGFTQIWHSQGLLGDALGAHDCFFTIGENIGSSACPIPTCGVPWRPVRQPVVLDDWPAYRSPGQLGRFTTVANWRGSYGPLQYRGRTFGVKAHEFRRFAELPSAVPEAVFEIALQIHPADEADRSLLVDQGWCLADPQKVARDPDAFRSYVQQSAAEFSVAQGVYVHTSSGWFSDRSVRYLASARPVLVQDTGLRGRLPIGRGLAVFSTPSDAVQHVQSILRDYEAHCEAAREIAVTYFAAENTLGRLVDPLHLSP